MYSPVVGGSTKLSVSGRLDECADDSRAYSLLAAIASPFCIWDPGWSVKRPVK